MIKNIVLLIGAFYVGRTLVGASSSTVINSVKLKQWTISDFQRNRTAVTFKVNGTFQNTFSFPIPSNSLRANLFLDNKLLKEVNTTLPTIPANAEFTESIKINTSIGEILGLIGLVAFDFTRLKRGLILKGDFISNGVTIPFESPLL